MVLFWCMTYYILARHYRTVSVLFNLIDQLGHDPDFVSYFTEGFAQWAQSNAVNNLFDKITGYLAGIPHADHRLSHALAMCLK